MQSRFLELRPLPKFHTHKLKEILEEHQYEGVEKENENNQHEKEKPSRCDIAHLLDNVQGSEVEIHKALNTLPVVEIDGCFRWLSFAFRSQLLADFVDACESEHQRDGHDFTVDRFGKESLVQFLTVDKSLPKDVATPCVEWIVRSFAGPVPNHQPSSADGVQCYRLLERPTCRLFAERLLCGASRFRLADFLSSWENSIPLTMTANPEYLLGLTITDKDEARPGQETIAYFPVEDLPEDPQHRFDLLFRRRQRWRRADIEPFLLDLVEGDAKEVGALLTKYCRSTTAKDGEKIYNSRDSAYSTY